MDHASLADRLSGISTVALTPFTAEEALDEIGLRRIIRYIDDGGTDTIVSCGGTGEYYALTSEERRRIHAVVVEEARHAPVLATVGLSAGDAIREARDAENLGAAGIMILPAVHPYTEAHGLLQYYREICRAVSVGVVVYVKDPAFSSELLQEVTAIENVIGVKYAINDLRRFASAVDDGQGDVVWVCGSAEAWAPFYWAAGATGFTSGLANVAVGESVRLRDALRSGDRKAVIEAWRRVRPMEDLRSRHSDANNVAALKAAASLRGLAESTVRPPLRALPESEWQEVTEILRGWDLLPEGKPADS
jgi:4-hydroxy-tetrahydrodipicolinate synthase